MSEAGEVRLLLLGGTPQRAAELQLMLLRSAALTRWHRTTDPHPKTYLLERLLWIQDIDSGEEIPEGELPRFQKRALSLLNSC